MKRVAVITPCLAPDRNYIRLLDESATRMGIELIPHGIGITFGGWSNMLISQTVPEMKRLAQDYSHVLYVDGRDSLFVTGLDEIIGKYRMVGEPECLMGSDFEHPSLKGYDRINAGGYFAEIGFMVYMWTQLATRHSSSDYQQWILDEWPIPGIYCDNKCSIFQSVEHSVTATQRRVVNHLTGELPCILHFRGGYSDPKTGREHRMKPALEQLYGGTA